jgi:beta-mannosidase
MVTLRNPAPVVALMAHLQLRRAKSNQRVLPVYYSDNYISLLPGQTRTVTIQASEKDLNGEAPLLMLDGWNINVKPVAGKNETVAVAPNLAALTIGTNAPQLNLNFHTALNTNP